MVILLCQVLSENVNFVHAFLQENFEGIKVSKPEGTYMLLLDCTDWCAAHKKSISEVLKACWDVGVAVQDGTMFFAPCSIRMNVALPLSRVQEAMARLAQWVFV